MGYRANGMAPWLFSFPRPIPSHTSAPKTITCPSSSASPLCIQGACRGAARFCCPFSYAFLFPCSQDPHSLWYYSFRKTLGSPGFFLRMEGPSCVLQDIPSDFWNLGADKITLIQGLIHFLAHQNYLRGFKDSFQCSGFPQLIIKSKLFFLVLSFQVVSHVFELTIYTSVF